MAASQSVIGKKKLARSVRGQTAPGEEHEADVKVPSHQSKCIR